MQVYRQQKYQPVRVEAPEPEVHFEVPLNVVPFPERHVHVTVGAVSELHRAGFERETAFLRATHRLFGRRHRRDFAEHVAARRLRHRPRLPDGRVFELDRRVKVQQSIEQTRTDTTVVN